MRTYIFGAACAGILLAGTADAQSRNQMIQEQLTALTKSGRTLQLGGPGEGYGGELRLSRNGTGKGEAVTDDGNRLTLTGTWEIRDGEFCRAWEEFGDGAEMCERWILTSPASVDVFLGDRKIGVNSW